MKCKQCGEFIADQGYFKLFTGKSQYQREAMGDLAGKLSQGQSNESY